MAQLSAEERRDEVRRRLLATVEEVTADGDSFSQVSVARLAKAAGISRALFYVYFDDKADLLKAWFEATTAELLDAAAAWWQLGPDPDRDELRAAILGMVALHREHSRLLAAVYDEAAGDPGVREFASRLIDQGREGITRHIERGQNEGWIDADLLTAETAFWLSCMVERGLLSLVGPASEKRAAALSDALADVVWSTLYG